MKLRRPEMVCAVLGILNRLPKTSTYEANLFFSKLRSSGVKRLRIFLWTVWGEQYSWAQMFGKWESQEDKFKIFNKPGVPSSGMNWNEEFFDNLKRLKNIAANWRISLYIDLGDHCSTNKKVRHKHPLYNNIDGINGMYDTGWKAQYMWREIIKKLIDVVGVRMMVPTRILGIRRFGKKPWYGLGNELYCSHEDRNRFGREWAYPKAHALRQCGYKGKILFSAHPIAWHKIRGWVSSDGVWNTEFKPRDTVGVIHGVDLYKDMEVKMKAVKAGRGFAISDDGTNVKEEARRAICINGNRYCSADAPSVIRLVNNIWSYMKSIRPNRCYFHHIEQLPRSVSEPYQSLGNLKLRDKNIYWKIALDVFGEDIRWKVPKWMKRRFLKEEK